jgi:hypothetical protein
MSDALPMVKNSLRAFISLLPLASSLEVIIITFSDEVKKVYPAASPPVTADDAIANMTASGMTNLGDAVHMAYSNAPAENRSWIVILTDGAPNLGPCQTLDSMKVLAEAKPKNVVKIITLGYGSQFNVDFLTALGEFTYLESFETIPRTMGGVHHEVTTASAFDVLIVPHQNGTTTDLFGSRCIPVLSADQTYVYGWRSSAAISHVDVSWTDATRVATRVYVSEVPRVEGEQSSVPAVVRQAYYFERANELINGVRLRFSLGPVSLATKRGEIDLARAVVSTWTDPIAEAAKETVLRIISKAEAGDNDFNSSGASAGQALSSQTSYADPLFQSPSAKRTSEAVHAIASGGILPPSSSTPEMEPPPPFVFGSLDQDSQADELVDRPGPPPRSRHQRRRL